jgi:sugar phosphate permease
MAQAITLKVDEMKGVQYKMLLISFSAYLTTYFAKYNISAVTGLIQEQFQISSADFGTILSVYSFVYIIGQFLAGFLGTRFNAKTVLLIGIAGSLVANIGFGFSNSVPFFSLFWGLNALSLSMVWSPLCGILFAWLPEKRWGWWMGILCAASYVGSALATPTAGFMAAALGWRSTFLFMPLIFGFSGLLILIFVKPSPEKAGLNIDWVVSQQKEKPKFTIKDYVVCLLNSKFLMLCLCYILANAVRWGMNNWIVKILNQPVEQGGYGLALTLSAVLGSSIHWGAALLSILTGLFTDRVFKGLKWPVICICFVIAGVGCVILSNGSRILNWPAGMGILFLLLFLIGGLTQAMMSPMSVIPADLFGSDRGIAGNGLLLGVAYIGPIFAGRGLGLIMDNAGNMAAIMTLAILCGVGALLSVAIRR